MLPRNKKCLLTYSRPFKPLAGLNNLLSFSENHAEAKFQNSVFEFHKMTVAISPHRTLSTQFIKKRTIRKVPRILSPIFKPNVSNRFLFSLKGNFNFKFTEKAIKFCRYGSHKGLHEGSQQDSETRPAETPFEIILGKPDSQKMWNTLHFYYKELSDSELNACLDRILKKACREKDIKTGWKTINCYYVFEGRELYHDPKVVRYFLNLCIRFEQWLVVSKLLNLEVITRKFDKKTLEKLLRCCVETKSRKTFLSILDIWRGNFGHLNEEIFKTALEGYSYCFANESELKLLIREFFESGYKMNSERANLIIASLSIFDGFPEYWPSFASFVDMENVSEFLKFCVSLLGDPLFFGNTTDIDPKLLLKLEDVNGKLIDENRKMSSAKKTLLADFNLLIACYGRLKNVDKALNVFESLGSFGLLPDVDSFTNVIEACVISDEQDKAESYFGNMTLLGIKPSLKTFIILIHMYGKLGEFDMVEKIENTISKHAYILDVRAYVALMSCYSKQKNISKLVKLFNKIHFGFFIVPFKLVIQIMACLSEFGRIDEIERKIMTAQFSLTNRLEMEICLIRAHAHRMNCHSLDKIWVIAHRISRRHLDNLKIEHINSLLKSALILENKDFFESSLELADGLKNEFTETTYIYLIEAFGRWKDSNLDTLFNEVLQKGGNASPDLLGALIKGFGYQGDFKYSKEIFESCIDDCSEKLPLYNGLLVAYAEGKNYESVLEVHNKMKELGIRPSKETLNIVVKSVSESDLNDNYDHCMQLYREALQYDAHSLKLFKRLYNFFLANNDADMCKEVINKMESFGYITENIETFVVDKYSI